MEPTDLDSAARAAKRREALDALLDWMAERLLDELLKETAEGEPTEGGEQPEKSRTPERTRRKSARSRTGK